jgi:alkylation response protein AidB-like acyl-CoA dehydrogenase
MDLRFTTEEIEISDEARAFMRDNVPEATRKKLIEGRRLDKHDLVGWQRILNRKGWAVSHWPREWGGTGWSPVELYIFRDEMQQAPAPEPLAFGVSMVGPVIIAFGNDAQKRKFLPRIANLDDWWCQGFSEPGAGSDLASLKTTARRDGGHYVVNGQKTWTTLAQYADWIFCLVRTDAVAKKKQEGISFLLIDMKSPGITVRPIQTIDGGHEVNEVFFDDVRVPAENLIGAENDGLRQVFMGLNPERIMGAALGNGIGRYALDKASAYARERKVWDVPIGAHQGLSHPLAHAKIQLELARLMTQRAASLHDAADPGSAEASNMAKYAAAEAGILALDQAIQTHGGNGLATEYGLATLWGPVRLMRTAPISREMILNYVAQHSLNLPRSY